MNIGNHLAESLGSLSLVVAQTAAEENASEVWGGWGSVILVVGTMVLVTIIIVVVLWQVFHTRRSTLESRAMIAQEEAYRRLAEESTSLQHRTAAELNQLTEGMADLRVRVATIERMLREVE